jgi:hypothetical protein
MESMIREMRQFVNPVPIVVDFVVVFTKDLAVRVPECKDAGSTSMEPVAWLRG